MADKTYKVIAGWQEEQYQNQRLTQKEIDYWETERAGITTPYTLDYAKGYSGILSMARWLNLMVLPFVFVCLCGSFSDDHVYKTWPILTSAKHGRKSLALARLAAGCSFAAGLTLVLSGVYILVYGGFYGLDGFSTALRLWSGGTLPLHLSMGGFVLVLLALLVLGCMAMGGLVMLISELLRSAVLALAVPFLLSGITVLGLFQGQGRLVQQVSSYLPFSRISTATLHDYFLVPPFQLNAIEFSVPLYVLLALLFGGLCWLCYRKYQVTGR